MKTRLYKVFVFLFFIAMNIHFAESPLPAPYYLYFVDGRLSGDSLISKENFAVRLFGMHKTYQPEYKALPGMNMGPERPVALTDSNGYFLITVSHYELLDSLKAGVVQPNKPVVFSPAYYVDKDRLKEIKEYYEPDEGPGCSSCSTMEPMETRTVRFEYYLDSVKIEIQTSELLSKGTQHNKTILSNDRIASSLRSSR